MEDPKEVGRLFADFRENAELSPKELAFAMTHPGERPERVIAWLEQYAYTQIDIKDHVVRRIENATNIEMPTRRWMLAFIYFFKSRNAITYDQANDWLAAAGKLPLNANETNFIFRERMYMPIDEKVPEKAKGYRLETVVKGGQVSVWVRWVFIAGFALVMLSIFARPLLQTISGRLFNRATATPIPTIAAATEAPATAEATVEGASTATEPPAATATLLPTPQAPTSAPEVALAPTNPPPPTDTPPPPTDTPLPTDTPTVTPTPQVFEQEYIQVKYRLLEVKKNGNQTLVTMLATREGGQSTYYLCAREIGNGQYCRLIDDRGNSYDGRIDTDLRWKIVDLPENAPFRFDVAFLGAVDHIAALEIPVTGGVVRFDNVPVPYP